MANEQIQRYDITQNPNPKPHHINAHLRESEFGDLVAYSDHLAATNELREGQMHLAQEVDALKAEVERLKSANELDRRALWGVVNAIDGEISGRMWLIEGRGPYEWDDDRYRQEFGWAVHALQEKLEPLRKIAHDLTNCPETEKGVDSVRKLEKENTSLREQVERLSAPVSENDLIAARIPRRLGGK